ncbi:MAG: M12 family metallopeptidase, partial [Chloroflexota bacterium]
MKKASAPKTPKSKKQTKVASEVVNAGTGDIRHSYIFGATFGLKQVTYSAIDGLAVFEGDIILGSVEEMETIKESVENPDPQIEAAAVVSGSQFRWTDGVIPFEIDPALPNQQRVTDAINHLQANTNLRFPARTTQPNWIRFQNGAGCSSRVGMVGGSQAITIGTGCDWPRAVHEMCHSAGLWHEQSREDRDRFVTIHLDNVTVANRHNFDQHVTDGDDIGPYDYDSIMHYGRRDFAIDSTKDTITPTPDP